MRYIKWRGWWSRGCCGRRRPAPAARALWRGDLTRRSQAVVRRRGRRSDQPAVSWRRRSPSGQPAAWQRRRGGGSRRTGHRAASPGQIRRIVEACSWIWNGIEFSCTCYLWDLQCFFCARWLASCDTRCSNLYYSKHLWRNICLLLSSCLAMIWQEYRTDQTEMSELLNCIKNFLTKLTRQGKSLTC